MKMTADVEGLDKLLKKLDELSQVEQSKALEEGLAKGGAIAVQRARQLVPVDSGDLRDNLHVGGYTKLTPGYRPVGAYGSLKKPGGSGKGKWVLAGSKLPYAHLVERGTKRTKPHPFLRPAVEESRDAIVAECDKAVQKVIDEG